jgi:peroxiredoxin
MRADIVPGATFPDYELTDHTSTRRKLSELQGIDPMVLILARGSFCPKDHQQHLELAANYSKIAVAYSGIVTISTDNIIETNEFRAQVGAQWTFLSDAGRHVQKDLDIKEYTDPFHDPMIPHTLVLKPGLIVHSLYNGYWFWGRPSFEDLWGDLREASREVRPDWDITAPERRQISVLSVFVETELIAHVGHGGVVRRRPRNPQRCELERSLLTAISASATS